MKGGSEDDTKAKRCRTGEGNKNESVKAEEDAKADGSPKPPEPPKDYIHVRARRGQATDSHSLAERVRIWKILHPLVSNFTYTRLFVSSKLCHLRRSGDKRSVREWNSCKTSYLVAIRCGKLLQDLVPAIVVTIFTDLSWNFNVQVTGKALMLDEIINYVQSLQRQVEVIQYKFLFSSSMIRDSLNEYI